MGTMMTRVPLRRRSAGYSLDEAACIGKAIRECHGAIACPRCGDALRHTVGTDGLESVWLLRCDACQRSVVIRNSQKHVGPVARTAS